ncbi:MAG: N-acetyltransferase [Dehalococcoidia bacterium]|nr:MAG: N-acetyltransferase [Dehalococcoidia bacterium]
MPHTPPPASHHNHLGQPIGGPVEGWTPSVSPARTAMAGRYCRLEPLNVAHHAEDLIAACAGDVEGRMWTYLPYGPFESPAAHRAWLADAAAAPDQSFFAILDVATGRAVGVAAYIRDDPRHGVIEVGHLAYSPLLQRTPASTEAMYLMMRRVFEECGYRRYEWKCNSHNAPSWDAAERLGFKFEGIFRQLQVVKGHNRDTTWLSILDSEWPALRAAFEAWLHPSNFDAEGQQRRRLEDFRTG